MVQLLMIEIYAYFFRRHFCKTLAEYLAIEESGNGIRYKKNTRATIDQIFIYDLSPNGGAGYASQFTIHTIKEICNKLYPSLEIVNCQKHVLSRPDR